MFTIGSEKGTNGTIVRVAGEATIGNVQEMRKALMPVIRSSDTVVLDTDGVTEADLSFLQFIDATHKELIRNGKHIGFCNDRIGGAVREAAQRTGYFTQGQCMVCDKKCLMHSLIA